MSDTLVIGGVTYTNVAGFKAKDDQDATQTYIKPSGTKQISISANGTTTENVNDYASAQITVNVVDPFDENADFCFWDYDGTPLYSYSNAELQQLTELPSPPDHSNDAIPLTFLYWNWTLADLKALGQAMDIGACYKPTDGKMHWTYRVNEGSGLTCSFATSYTNDVTIDWGDGTVEHWGSQTENGANPTHTYAAAGDYHCTWDGEGRPTGAMRTEGNGSVVGQFILGNSTTAYWLGSWWSGTLSGSAVETIITNDLMSGQTNMAFPIPDNCNKLKAFVFNPYFKASGNILRYCSSLKVVCFSNSSQNWGDYLCAYCTQLKRARVAPTTVWNRFAFSGTIVEFFCGPKLGYKDFDSARLMRRVVIKSTIDSTALGANVFLEEVWCGLSTPPALSSATPFSGMRPWGKIHVPAAYVNDYKEASNWLTYEDRIVGDWTADPIK